MFQLCSSNCISNNVRTSSSVQCNHSDFDSRKHARSLVPKADHNTFGACRNTTALVEKLPHSNFHRIHGDYRADPSEPHHAPEVQIVLPALAKQVKKWNARSILNLRSNSREHSEQQINLGQTESIALKLDSQGAYLLLYLPFRNET